MQKRRTPLVSATAVGRSLALTGLLLSWTGMPGISHAEVPETIAYVGEVTDDASGLPFSGALSVEVALYATDSEPTPVWGPVSLGTVDVDFGVLRFSLGGPDTPSLDGLLEDHELWLELTLDGQVLSPRQAMLAVPYARLAANSERLGGVEAAEYVQATELSPVASTGSYSDLADGSDLALIADLADIAFTGDVASLQGDPAASILADAFVSVNGDTMQGDLDYGLNRFLDARVMAAASEPHPCGPDTLGLMYLDTSMDALRVCGVSGWVSGGGTAPPPTPTVFAPTTNPVEIDQLTSPGTCAAVGFTNFADSPAVGFFAPVIEGDYSPSGCPASSCAGTLDPGESCQVFVRGIATGSGPLAGSVTVTASVGGTAVATLTGTATLSTGPELVAVASPVQIDQTSVSGPCQEVQITNTGSAPATGFGAPVVTGDYTASSCAASTCIGVLEVGEICFVYVRGTASVSGPISGSVSVTATDGGTAVVSLSGTASLTDAQLNLVVAHNGSPYLTLYDANTAPFVKEPNPTALPPSNASDLDISEDGTLLAVTHAGLPYFSVYDMTEDPPAKLSNPAANPPNTTTSAAISPNNERLAITHYSSPFVSVYDTTSAPYQKVTAPVVTPPNTAWDAAWSPDGNYLALGHAGLPGITVYLTTVVPYAKLDNPPNAFTSNSFSAYSVEYSPDGSRLIAGLSHSPFAAVYDTTTFPFTKVNPFPSGQAPTSLVWDTEYSPDGKWLAFGSNSAPFLAIYDTTTSPWTRLADPNVLPPSGVRGVAFSPDGQWFAVAHSGAPYTTVYDATSVPFTKVINPNVPPSSTALDLEFVYAP